MRKLDYRALYEKMVDMDTQLFYLHKQLLDEDMPETYFYDITNKLSEGRNVLHDLAIYFKRLSDEK